MKITFLPAAEHELDEAFDYYETQKPGLGFEFIEEVSAAIKRIELYPEAWQLISKNARRCPNISFPLWSDISDSR